MYWKNRKMLYIKYWLKICWQKQKTIKVILKSIAFSVRSESKSSQVGNGNTVYWYSEYIFYFKAMINRCILYMIFNVVRYNIQGCRYLCNILFYNRFFRIFNINLVLYNSYIEFLKKARGVFLIFCYKKSLWYRYDIQI